MSKISQLHADLSEQATDLGYKTLEQALDDGWCVDYDEGRLYKRIDVQEEAHAEWLKEREEVLKRLNNLYDELVYIDMDDEYLATVNDAIDFIKKGEV